MYVTHLALRPRLQLPVAAHSQLGTNYVALEPGGIQTAPERDANSAKCARGL